MAPQPPLKILKNGGKNAVAPGEKKPTYPPIMMALNLGLIV